MSVPDGAGKGAHSEEPRRPGRHIPIVGGIAGAAELPIAALYASYLWFDSGPSAVLFVIAIPLGALLGVLAGERLIDAQSRQPRSESYPRALGFGIPASLTFGCVMSAGGPIEVGAWLLGIYTCCHWIALGVWAAIARNQQPTSGTRP